MHSLKLVALDEDDLKVFSAHLQDAVLRVTDMAYLPAKCCFAAALNRFDWLGVYNGQEEPRNDDFERCRTALRFGKVVRAQLHNIELSDKNQVMELLAIQFEATQPPGGFVTLIFAGDSAIRLEVECIEAELKDLGPAWHTRLKPHHSDHGG